MEKIEERQEEMMKSERVQVKLLANFSPFLLCSVFEVQADLLRCSYVSRMNVPLV